MLDRRWIKIINDLWLYKSRTINVIAAIALGVIGIGIVTTTRLVLLDNYVSQYWASEPAQARVSLTSFGENLLRGVRKLPEVVMADARHTLSTKAEVTPGNTLMLQLQAIPDFTAIQIDKLTYLTGAEVPPPKCGVLLERSILNVFSSIHRGDTIQVRMPDGKQHALTVAGFVVDNIQIPTPISSQIYGYITFETAAWLEHDEKGVFDPRQDQNYDRLLIVTDASSLDKVAIEDRVNQFKRDLASLVPKPPYSLSYSIPSPGKPTLQDNVNSMWIVLQIAGIASMGLSGFLVVNVMTALISQQIKQIGILKAIGGRRLQICMMYLLMAMVLGGVAFIIAVPIGLLGAWGVTRFIANILNTDVRVFYLPWTTLAMQATTSLLVPALATLMPAWAGTRMTAREAMQSTGDSGSSSSKLLPRLPRLAIPLQITLATRNVFRQRIRLALTLVALSIGGSTFIAVIGANNALNVTFDKIKAENAYDIQIRYELPNDKLQKDVEKAILEVPGVRRVESWKLTTMRRVLDDGSMSGSVSVIALDPDTVMLRPNPVQGQWLNDDQRNILYVNFDALETFGQDALTRPIKLEMNGAKEMWQIVGMSGRTLNPIGYICMDDFDRYYKTSPAQHIAVIQTNQRDNAFAEGVESQIMQLFKQKKWQVDSSITLSRNILSAWKQINNVVLVLLGTAALVAAVGGLGLANTLELNVMEHTREIGVLRSLGAKSQVIRVMVTTESMTICAMSTVIGALLAQPLGAVLCNLIGDTLLARKVVFEFPLIGLLLWIVVIGTLSLLASLSPAQNAINLTVRDTLAYE